MIRILFFFSALVLVPLQVLALGLGDIKVNSSLNQPLDAVIELIAVDKGEIDDIKAGLADAIAFSNAGLDRPFFLTKLRFQPLEDAQGNTKVSVTSATAIREPFLNFIVQLNWRGGVMFREYALLLDPPDYNIASTEIQAAPVAAQTPQTPQTRPESFSATRYGPVRTSETLWVIADKIRPDRQITIEQMMMALQRANQDAFVDNNANRLRVGSVLNIPTRAEIEQTDPATARNQFIAQTNAWRSSIRQTPPTPDVEPGIPGNVVASSALASEMQPAPAAKPMATESGGGRLRVVETGRDWLLSTASHLGKEVYPGNLTEQLREEIADSEQDLEAVQEINRDLDNLKSALEGKIDTLRTALEEKDQAIADLRQQLESAAVAKTAQTGEGMVPVTSLESEEGSINVAAAPTAPENANSAPVQESSKPVWLDERWQISAAVILLGLLIIAWVLTRRRQKEVGSAADILMPVSGFDEEDTATIKEGELLGDIFEPETTSKAHTSDEPVYHEPPADVAAVLTEADIYLAYRRYTQAENLIKDAMRSSPDNPELMAKLLEVYAFKKDRKGYSDYLTSISPQLQGYSSELWERVLDMTRDLIPDHPILFADQDAALEEDALGVQLHQEELELGGDIPPILKPEDQTSPDVSVDELVVEGDEDDASSAVKTSKDNPPSAEQRTALDQENLVLQPEPYSLDDVQPLVDEINMESAEEERPFSFELEDIPDEDLIEHEIMGLDIDLELENKGKKKKP